MAYIKRILLLIVAAVAINCAQARVYLVSAGIEDYSRFPQKGVNDLPNTCKDARGIKYVYDKNKAVTSLLLNSQASKAGIINAVTNTFSKAGPDDIVVFFFSGHGLPGGICASDGLLFYDDLIAAMAKSQSKNKMMFIHSCHSGSIRTEANRGNKSVKSAQDGNVLLFLSSRGNEYSWTNSLKEFSYFTDYLQRALRGKADVNRDRVITAKELYEYVTKGVTKATGNEQHPVMWGKFSDDMPVMVWK